MEIKSKLDAAAHREKDKGIPPSWHEFVPFAERMGSKGVLWRKDQVGDASFPQALPLGLGTWEARSQT